MNDSNVRSLRAGDIYHVPVQAKPHCNNQVKCMKYDFLRGQTLQPGCATRNCITNINVAALLIEVKKLIPDLPQEYFRLPGPQEKLTARRSKFHEFGHGMKSRFVYKRLV